MRIERLYMKNFSPIFVALDKTEVTLDYTKVPNKVINIFIGQMGSCKTFILGHHQPFATLGTLDVRNNEDLILEGKQGIKEIVYRSGDDLFEIKHVYNPGKNTHSVKSYIRKNGTELNENGNSSSFKVIIDTEFGLDQSFLKLFRIGSNVTNLPDMTATERKTFISSMLSETEIYTMIYKKLGDESRSLNAQTTILINKLHMISDRPREDLEADRDVEEILVRETQEKIDHQLQEQYRLDGIISALRNGQSEAQFARYIIDLEARVTQTDDTLKEKQDELDSIKDYLDPSEVNQAITTYRTQIDMRKHQMTDLKIRIDEDTGEKDRISDQLAIIGSKDHIDTLRSTYNELMRVLKGYEDRLKHFTYSGSSGSIVSLQHELQNMNALINDVSQYNAETIKALLRNSRGALHRAEREKSRLDRDRDRLQREINNITQTMMYQPTHPMVLPFNCPTKDCPFYKYHPLNEQRRNRAKNVDKIFLEHRNEIRRLEAQIYLFEEYPVIARKLDTIKSIWKSLHVQAQDLGILKEEDLGEIITNLMHRDWYDTARLQRIYELCGIREKYYELMQKVASMRNDLTQYEASDADKLHADLAVITARLDENMKIFEQLEDANRSDNEELARLDDAYLKISSMEQTKRDISALKIESQRNHQELDQLRENQVKIDEYLTEITEIKTTLTELREQFRVHNRTLEVLKRKISELTITVAQYEETLTRKKIIGDILDAVSSKKGIPLAFVKLFLADCKDDLNDLISDVFEDSIEIQDFDIPEDGTEFNIPYTRNGTLIGDINKSSQGERAIISLALSFALIRQRAFQYNIILLDEVDGPLHKSARMKFLTILFKQLQAIKAEQVFIVSHNNTFDGYNVNVIKTTNELVDENPLTSVMMV